MRCAQKAGIRTYDWDIVGIVHDFYEVELERINDT